MSDRESRRLREQIFVRMDEEDAASEGNCRVYAMAAFFGDCTKIGITNNLRARLASVQTGSSLPLDYVCVSPPMTRREAREIEAAIHRGLAETRQQGEWFALNWFKVREYMRQVVQGLHE